jgi:hypothetical protein
MKYVRSFESFRNNRKEEVLNEEILGLGKLFGGLFKKMKGYINKIKGGKDVEAIYQKYTKMIQDEINKQTKLNLDIMAASSGEDKSNLAAAAKGEQKPEVKSGEQKVEQQKASKFYSKSIGKRIFEADATAGQPAAGQPAAGQPAAGQPAAGQPAATDKPAEGEKVDLKILKAKKGVIDQIVKKYKDMAMKEMDAILKKYGGAAGNPQLDKIITAKKDQFELDMLNAEMSALEKSGDKAGAAEIGKQAAEINKKIEDTYKGIETLKPMEFKEGSEIIYLKPDKKKEEWDALTPEEKKKPTEGKAKDIVGVSKITKINGDKIIIDEDGKPVEKTTADIIGSTGSAEPSGDFKEGDSVIYLKQDKKKEEWEALSDDEKKKPTEGTAAKIVAIGKVKSKEGDKFVIEYGDEGKTTDKMAAEVISKSEGTKVEGQDDLVKQLADIKAKSPEDIKEIGNIAKLYVDPEANKDKIEQIDKIIGETK